MIMDTTIKRAAQIELRRLGFTRTSTSKSGSSYYERINIDVRSADFGEVDTARLADHYHPTNFNGIEIDVSGFLDAREVIEEIQESFGAKPPCMI